MEKFRMIEDFRDDYKNSTFWILGSDPNLDFYPDDFFDNKHSIAIYSSCIAFPNSTFFLMSTIPIADAIKYMRPDFLSKCIMPLNYAKKNQKPMPYWEQLSPCWQNYGLDPIYMKLIEGPQVARTLLDQEKMVKQIFGKDSVEFTQPTSSTHYGIEIAAVLGAKKIILVGCSHKTTKYFFHAQKRGMWIFSIEEHLDGKDTYPASFTNGTIPQFIAMRKDTIWLKKEFAKHGVEIVRHKFDEKKQEFVFEEI